MLSRTTVALVILAISVSSVPTAIAAQENLPVIATASANLESGILLCRERISGPLRLCGWGGRRDAGSGPSSRRTIGDRGAAGDHRARHVLVLVLEMRRNNRMLRPSI